MLAPLLNFGPGIIVIIVLGLALVCAILFGLSLLGIASVEDFDERE